jgi:hypothetical protein
MFVDSLLQSLTLLYLMLVLGQSGLDKLLNYTGNLAYFREQFKNSPLGSTVGLLLPAITLMEVGAAVLSAVGLFSIWTSGNTLPGVAAVALACLNFIALIFGQRMAKDYGGAAGIVPYLGVALFGLYCFS